MLHAGTRFESAQMQSTKFRRGGPEDVDAIRDLSRAAYAKWVALIGREPLPMTADYARAVFEHVIDLLEEGGQLLALVEVIRKPDHLLIENVAVRPDQQGKGLGDIVLRHAEELARSMKYNEVRLYTNAAFASNISFYSKRGYEEYQRGTMVPGSVTIYMKKRIDDQVTV
jgi:GNAT superfamily N-acetyltransferase